MGGGEGLTTKGIMYCVTSVVISFSRNPVQAKADQCYYCFQETLEAIEGVERTKGKMPEFMENGKVIEETINLNALSRTEVPNTISLKRD